jgi:hypothetical protein
MLVTSVPIEIYLGLLLIVCRDSEGVATLSVIVALAVREVVRTCFVP